MCHVTCHVTDQIKPHPLISPKIMPTNKAKFTSTNKTKFYMWSMCHHTPTLPYTRHPRPAPHACAHDTHAHARHTRMHATRTDTHTRRDRTHRMPPTCRHTPTERTANPYADDAQTCNTQRHIPNNEEHHEHQRHTNRHTEHHAKRHEHRKTAMDRALSRDKGPAG